MGSGAFRPRIGRACQNGAVVRSALDGSCGDLCKTMMRRKQRAEHELQTLKRRWAILTLVSSGSDN